MPYPYMRPMGPQPGLNHPPRTPCFEIIHDTLRRMIRPDHRMHMVDLNVDRVQIPASVPANLLRGAQDDGALLRPELYGRVSEALSAGSVAPF